MSMIAWLAWVYLATGAWTLLVVSLTVRQARRTGELTDAEDRALRIVGWRRIAVMMIVKWPSFWVAMIRK